MKTLTVRAVFKEVRQKQIDLMQEKAMKTEQ